MTDNEIIQMVNGLNADLLELDENENFCLEYGLTISYVTDGYIQVITFMDFVLWNDDNDDRAYIELEDDYEPLEPFIRRKFKELIAGVSRLSLEE
jgi:hypothetical protein